MKKIFCDKCGIEVDGSTEPFFLDFKIKKIKRYIGFPSEETKIHLCGNCCDKLNAWIEEKIEGIQND